MLTKFLSALALIFGGFGLGAIFGASITFFGYNQDLKNAGYEWSIKVGKKDEKEN